ncbi:MAG: flagellar hook-length control protein FliK [Thiobacillus sp.]|nr:flagellar hook-length control protein FliK [Thiobacillus sp.]
MTPSANLNPVTALQAQPTGKKQSSPAADDASFSRALSNEIAQKKSSEANRNESKSEPKQAEPSRSASATRDASAPEDSASTDSSTRDSLNTSPAETGALQPEAPQPVAEAVTLLPDAMLALAAVPVQLSPLPPTSGMTDADTTLLAQAPILPASLTGNAAPTVLPGQLVDSAADSQAAAQQPVKADFQAAMTATSAHASAAAAALPGQIAAALSPDTIKLDETRPDGISTPLMAGPQHALLSTISGAPASAASNALAPSVGSAAWGQALGEKIVWMTAGAQQTASLTLNPPNLGPLQIVLNVTNDQATASFFSAQPEVRQALEAALPKLREMMNESGIQLGQATVSAEQQQHQQNEAANREARRIASSYPGGTTGAIDSAIQTLPLPRQSGRGLIDTFA